MSFDQEKQAESIIEKLCQRFRLATEERQWRDISFCLSLLPFKSERSMKKLIEGCVECYLRLWDTDLVEQIAVLPG